MSDNALEESAADAPRRSSQLEPQGPATVACTTAIASALALKEHPGTGSNTDMDRRVVDVDAGVGAVRGGEESRQHAALEEGPREGAGWAEGDDVTVLKTRMAKSLEELSESVSVVVATRSCPLAPFLPLCTTSPPVCLCLSTSVYVSLRASRHLPLPLPRSSSQKQLHLSLILPDALDTHQEMLGGKPTVRLVYNTPHVGREAAALAEITETAVSRRTMRMSRMMRLRLDGGEDGERGQGGRHVQCHILLRPAFPWNLQLELPMSGRTEGAWMGRVGVMLLSGVLDRTRL